MGSGTSGPACPRRCEAACFRRGPRAGPGRAAVVDEQLRFSPRFCAAASTREEKNQETEHAFESAFVLGLFHLVQAVV